MAKVTYGPVVSSASGKVAGTVFSQWRTRPIIRRLVRPSNPNTVPQQEIREAFKLQTKRFLRFNSDLVQAWRNYAAGKPLTRRSAFIGKTVQDERLLNAWIMTPHEASVFPVVDLVVTPGVGQLVLDWDNDALPSSGDTLVFWYNQTDEGLTVSMQIELLNAITSTITPLTAAKTYGVGVCKKDDSVTPAAYGLAIVAEGIPT